MNQLKVSKKRLVNINIKSIKAVLSQASKSINGFLKVTLIKEALYFSQKTELEKARCSNFVDLFLKFQAFVKSHTQILNSWLLKGLSTKG